MRAKIQIPPSLKNIYKEIINEFPERNYTFNHGNLTRWFVEEKIFLDKESVRTKNNDYLRFEDCLRHSEQENQSGHNHNSTADSKKARENSSQYTRQKELKDHHIFSQVVPLSSLAIIRDMKMITDKWMKTQKKTGLEE